jgi:photosystem II stability/assembly factor-like uncharacterized protein
MSVTSFIKLTLCLVLVLFITVPLHAQQTKKDDLFSVTFTDEKNGWACGYWGTILHTPDGGKTWVSQKSTTDYPLTSIHFVDPQYGWAVGDGGTILSTKDGGTTWTPQKSPEPIFLMGVYFANRQKGWAVGERMTIIATVDGGATWQTQFKGEDYVLKSVSFADEKNGWAVGEYGFIYHTTDGKTWKHEAGSFGFSQETGQIVGGNFLFSVTAVDQKTAWAVGIDGYVTMTNGKTWQTITTCAPKVHLFGIASDKRGNIAIVGKGTLITSSDRGKTWQTPKLTPSIEYGWLYGVSAHAAVGGAGAIYTHNNSGPWTRVTY